MVELQSLLKAIFDAFGMSCERMNYESEEFFGSLPQGIAIPGVPFARTAVLRGYLPYAARAVIRRQRTMRELGAFTTELPRKTAELEPAVTNATTPEALAQLCREEIEPLIRQAYRMLQAGTSRYENAYRPLRRKLVEQVGAEDANLLLSDVSVPGERLASLGPLVGAWQVAQGKMSRADYANQYGHRGPHDAPFPPAHRTLISPQ